MADNWDRGVMVNSSWHMKEKLVELASADELIKHAEEVGAWPTHVELTKLFAESETLGLPVDVREQAVLATYAQHPQRVLGVVGGRYTPTPPARMRSLVRAACVNPMVKPEAGFSLDDGRKVLATFKVNGSDDGIEQFLLICDSFDGSTKLTVGTTSIRVVCQNTLSMAMQSDGRGMAALRHSASLEEQINILEGEIGTALQTGQKMRDLYNAAKSVKLTRDGAQAIFDSLFPAAPEGASKHAVTKAENERADARKAMVNPVNAEGGTLATLWNAATFLVDRKADGSERAVKGGDSLESLIFGTRGKRVNEIETTIENIVEMVRADGSIVSMPVPDAAQTESQKNAFADLLGLPSTIN